MTKKEFTYAYKSHEITICPARGLFYWITDGDTDDENLSPCGFDSEKEAKTNAEEFLDEVDEIMK